MSQDTKSRVLYYRRANWSGQRAATLESLLTSAHSKCRSTEERLFAYGDSLIVGLKCRNSDGILLHIAAYTPKQKASIIPNPSKRDESDTGTQDPPTGHEFMDGDIFVYVKGDHILLCPSGLRENAAVAYFKYLIRKVEKEDLSNNFDVLPVADMDKVGLIKEEGVKKIQLSESMYEASFDHLERKTIKATLIQAVAKEILSFVSKEQSPHEKPENLENLMVKLEISFDSRKKGGKISKGRLAQLGKKLASEHESEGVQILTGSGKKINSEEIRLSKRTDLIANADSVSYTDAWEKLKGYYHELKKQGMLSR